MPRFRIRALFPLYPVAKDRLQSWGGRRALGGDLLLPGVRSNSVSSSCGRSQSPWLGRDSSRGEWPHQLRGSRSVRPPTPVAWVTSSFLGRRVSSFVLLYQIRKMSFLLP